LAIIMDQVAKEVRVGVATKDLDRLAEKLIAEHGGEPSFKGPVSKGFGGFPAAICVSVNEEVVHGVPSDNILKEGDIVSLDLGVYYQGFHTDMAVTVGVGVLDPASQRLIRVSKKALKRGIKKARPGNTIGDIGNTIERYVESQGFSVIRELCGHGIGKRLHEDPQILNYGKRHTGSPIKEGMVLCIEPMVASGGWPVEKKEDGMCYVTKDRSRAAHFEHTIAILDNGPDVLTLLNGGARASGNR
jgi:methionyl aminopeptidase